MFPQTYSDMENAKDELARMNEVGRQLAAKMGPPVEPPAEEINRRIDDFDKIIPGSTSMFQICVDLRTLSFFRVKNYAKVMGYEEYGLDMERHFSYIPAPENQAYRMSGVSLWPLLIDHVDQGGHIIPFQSQYAIRFPMWHADGRLLEIQQITYPLQLDASGYMVSYMSTYTVVDEFEDPQKRRTGLYLRIIDNNMSRLRELESNVIHLNQVRFKNPFSPRQTEILKLIADCSYPISMSLLAQKLKIRRDTLYEYISRGKHNISDRAEKHAKRVFHNVYEVAHYYRSLRLI